VANAWDVAAYLVSRADLSIGDGLTHLRLQKLLYYAQGFSLAILGHPLFPEELEAWPNGPVVPELYGPYFRRYGSKVVSRACGGDPKALSPEERDLVDRVFEVYRNYSASRLLDLTREELPWREAEHQGLTIPQEALRAFFPGLLDERGLPRDR